MSIIDKIRKRFSKDYFAADVAGAVIDMAEEGHAICSMKIRPMHLNANSTVMGGAIFTLADFAFAVASNGCSDRITVTQHVSVSFLAPAEGEKLIAEARCIKAGRTTCLYTVDVRDENNSLKAYLTVNGYTKDPK